MPAFPRTAGKWMLALAFALPAAAHAHRVWMLPSATVLSEKDAWVTVDAAVSNEVFYFEHRPMALGGLQVSAPDGSAVQPEQPSTGRFRSTFDLKLAQPGTYRIASVGESLLATFRQGGETRRLRGTVASLASSIPADATDLRVVANANRVETFVTVGKPSTRTLQPTGRGLEMVPVTHPNDLSAGSTARLRFLLDGKPAAGLKLELVPGGVRYRDRLNDRTLVTDAQGETSIAWPQPGMYWLHAETEPTGDGGSLAAPARRASYTATLEVLP